MIAYDNNRRRAGFHERNNKASLDILAMSRPGTISLAGQLTVWSQSYALTFAFELGGPLNEQEPYSDRDEVIVCMVLAFCIGNTIITLVYRLTS
jgi:hypothetical protein